MRRDRRPNRRSALLAIVFAIGWMLATIVPAKALYCSEGLDQVCNLVFGTQCKVTHEYPCHP